MILSAWISVKGIGDITQVVFSKRLTPAKSLIVASTMLSAIPGSIVSAYIDKQEGVLGNV